MDKDSTGVRVKLFLSALVFLLLFWFVWEALIKERFFDSEETVNYLSEDIGEFIDEAKEEFDKLKID